MTKQQQTFRRLVSLLLVFLMLMGVFGIMSIHVRSIRTDDWQQRRSALLVDAVNCLKNARHEDGSFGSYTGLVNETAEAAGAVRYAEPAYDTALTADWLRQNGSRDNNDTAARTAAAAGDQDLLKELMTAQNRDGGLGLRKNDGSDVLDTVLALQAVNDVSITGYASQGSMLCEYLADNVQSSGGWAYSSGSQTDTILTAMAVYNIARFMKVNQLANDRITAVLAGADSYLTEKTELSFTKDKLEACLYTQLAHLAYTGRIDYKSVIKGLEDIRDADGSFYSNVHLTASAVRLLQDMDLDNALHIYDLVTAVGPQAGYLRNPMEVSVSYGAAYLASADQDCTLRLTVRNGSRIIEAQEKDLTLTEDQTAVNGSFDAFTVEELTDDGIVVTVSLYHGETLLRSAEETITLAEPPVAGATELTDFSLTLDQYNGYEGYPAEVTAQCELLYSTNVASQVSMHYTVTKGGMPVTEKTVPVPLTPDKTAYKGQDISFTADDKAGTVYTVKAECIYEEEVLATRTCLFTVGQRPVIPEPYLNVFWAGPVLTDYSVYAGIENEITADVRISYEANADWNRTVRIAVTDSEGEVIAEKSQPITLTTSELAIVDEHHASYPSIQTDNMLTFTVKEEGKYTVTAALLAEDGTVINSHEATVNVMPKPQQELILYSSVQSKTDDSGKKTDSVDLSWNDISGDYDTYNYGLRRRIKGGEWESRSIWNESEKIRVLNVYPAYPYLKDWMENTLSATAEPAGMGIFDIDSIHFNSFNSNPLSYMKDEQGKWNYDVVFFGSSDSNSCYDLSAAAGELMHQFADEGRGILFGHDTVCTNLGHYNFASFADELGILVMDDCTVWPTTSVSVIKIGTLTNFPWNIRGTLNIPSCHSYGQYVGGTLEGTEWMSLNTDRRYDEATGSHSNFYLVTNKNLGMIQTGHSNGQATDDECKVLANTLFYLYQRSRLTTARDSSFYDLDAPDQPTAAEATVKGTTVSVPVHTKDNPTTYEYYVEAAPENDATHETIRSNVETQTVLAGLKGYVVGISDSDQPCPELITYDENGEFVQNVVPADENGDAVVTGTLPDTGKPYYMHIFAVDHANNVSEETIILIGKAAVTTAIYTDKAVYDVNETVKVSTVSSAVLFDIQANAVLALYDSKGNCMATLNTAEQQALSLDSQFTLDGEWLIPAIYSGAYTAKITWSIDGEEVTSAECVFTVAANGGVNNDVYTDQPAYGTDEPVTILHQVNNLSTNADADNLTLKVTVYRNCRYSRSGR